jgi:hypothetical protein
MRNLSQRLAQVGYWLDEPCKPKPLPGEALRKYRFRLAAQPLLPPTASHPIAETKHSDDARDRPGQDRVRPY